jgi:hypothetical protein
LIVALLFTVYTGVQYVIQALAIRRDTPGVPG